MTTIAVDHRELTTKTVNFLAHYNIKLFFPSKEIMKFSYSPSQELYVFCKNRCQEIYNRLSDCGLSEEAEAWSDFYPDLLYEVEILIAHFSND